MSNKWLKRGLWTSLKRPLKTANRIYIQIRRSKSQSLKITQKSLIVVNWSLVRLGELWIWIFAPESTFEFGPFWRENWKWDIFWWFSNTVSRLVLTSRLFNGLYVSLSINYFLQLIAQTKSLFPWRPWVITFMALKGWCLCRAKKTLKTFGKQTCNPLTLLTYIVQE